MIDQRTALVTGASSGIGLEIARELHARGLNLILVARNQARLERVTRDAFGDTNTITTIALDLSERDAAERLHRALDGHRVDVLVNNAGGGVFGEHWRLDPERIERMLTLNIHTPTRLCALVGDEMRARRSGCILNVASTAAYQPVPYFAAYAASKSYVLNFSEALAKELEDYGVRVSCLSPGHTDTEFFNAAGIGAPERGLFAKAGRMNARRVARFAIRKLDQGRLSFIPGFANQLLAFSNRIVSRRVAAVISKRMARPTS